MQYLWSLTGALTKTILDIKEYGGTLCIEFTDGTALVLESGDQYWHVERSPSPRRQFKYGHISETDYQRLLVEVRERSEEARRARELKELARLKEKYE